MFNLFSSKKKALKYQEVKARFKTQLQESITITDIEKDLLFLCDKFPQRAILYKKAFFVLLKDIDTDIVLKYGEDIVKEEKDLNFIKVLAIRYKRVNNYVKYNALMSQYFQDELLHENRNNELLRMVRDRILELIKEQRTFISIEDYILLKIKQYPDDEIEIKKLFFREIKDIYTKEVLPYGVEVVEKGFADNMFKQVVEKRQKNIEIK